MGVISIVNGDYKPTYNWGAPPCMTQETPICPKNTTKHSADLAPGEIRKRADFARAKANCPSSYGAFRWGGWELGENLLEVLSERFSEW